MEKANNRDVIAIGCQSRGGLLEKEKIKKKEKERISINEINNIGNNSLWKWSWI